MILKTFAVLLLVHSQAVMPLDRTGNYLHSLCANDAAWADTACSMYILATLETFNEYATASEEFNYTYCPPPSSTMGQAVDIARKYLTDHPEKRHERSVTLIIDAMAEAFPCPAEKKH